MEITESDIESTYKVLEKLRDVWLENNTKKCEVNDVHCIVQEFEKEEVK